MNAVVCNCLPGLMYDTSLVTPLMNELRMCGLSLEDCFQRYQEEWASFGICKWEDMLQVLTTFQYEWVTEIFKDFSPAPAKLQSPINGSVVKIAWDNSVMQRLMAWVWWLEALQRGPSVELLKLCLQELPRSVVQGLPRDGMDYRMFPWVRTSDLEDTGENAGLVCFQSFREGIARMAGDALFLPTSTWWPPVLLAACRWCCHFMKGPGGRLDHIVMNSYFEKLNAVNPEYRGQTLQLVLAFDDHEASIGSPHMIRALDAARYRFSNELCAVELPPPEWPALFQ